MLSICFTITYGIFIAFNYKEYGLTSIKNDKFLTLAGSLGGLANGVSRLFWGVIQDKLSFRLTLAIINIGFLILSFTIYLVNHVPYAYLTYVILTYFFYGGCYAIYPALSYKVYGQTHGARIYSFLFSGFIIASLLQLVFHLAIVQSDPVNGFKNCFITLGFVQIVGLAMVLVFKYDVDWSEVKTS